MQKIRPDRADDALQGLEAVVDWEDVLLAVRYGRELQRKATKWRFTPAFCSRRSGSHARLAHLGFVEVLQAHAVNGGAQLARSASLERETFREIKVRWTELDPPHHHRG